MDTALQETVSIAYLEMLHDLSAQTVIQDTNDYNLAPGQRVFINLPLYIGKHKEKSYDVFHHTERSKCMDTWTFRVPFRYIPPGLCNVILEPTPMPFAAKALPHNILSVVIKEGFFITEMPFPICLLLHIFSTYAKIQSTGNLATDCPGWFESAVKSNGLFDTLETQTPGERFPLYSALSNVNSTNSMYTRFERWLRNLYADLASLSHFEMALAPNKLDFVAGVPIKRYMAATTLGNIGLIDDNCDYAISKFGVVYPYKSVIAISQSDPVLDIRFLHKSSDDVECAMEAGNGKKVFLRPARYRATTYRFRMELSDRLMHYLVVPARASFAVSGITMEKALLDEHNLINISQDHGTCEPLGFTPKNIPQDTSMILSPMQVYLNSKLMFQL